MKLSETFLCVECDELFTFDVLEVDKKEGRRVFGCPSCGCTASMRLSRIVIPMSISDQMMPRRDTVY